MGIEARELRIGNLVKLYRKPEDQEMTTHEIYGIPFIDEWNSYCVELTDGFVCAVGGVCGIPLTEEWLLKFGFTKKIESETLTVFWIGHNKLTHDYLFEVKHIEGYPFFYRNGTHAIHYVHQIQNLYYALTNQELTIKE